MALEYRDAKGRIEDALHKWIEGMIENGTDRLVEIDGGDVVILASDLVWLFFTEGPAVPDESTPDGPNYAALKNQLSDLAESVDLALEYDTGARVAGMMDALGASLKTLGRRPYGWGSELAARGWQAGAKAPDLED